MLFLFGNDSLLLVSVNLLYPDYTLVFTFFLIFLSFISLLLLFILYSKLVL